MGDEIPLPQIVGRHLQLECAAMVRYVLAAGLPLPPGIVTEIEEAGGDPEQLRNAHAALASVIAPAKPGTLRVLEAEEPKRRSLRLFGPTLLVSWLLWLGLASTVAFTILAVDANTGAPRDMNGKSTRDVLYLLSAAALGATFGALFRAHRYITALTYEKRFESSYVILLVLGLIGGLILGLLVPVEENVRLTQPLLAVVGGFSAPAVYRILQRAVQSVLALFGPEEGSRERERQAAARAFDQVQAERTSFANSLVQLTREQDPAAFRQAVHALAETYLGRPQPSGRSSS